MFLQSLYPRKVQDGTVIPPNAAGFNERDNEMRAFADQLIAAGLITYRSTDTCGTMWFWPVDLIK